jgi:hypothetical protein
MIFIPAASCQAARLPALPPMELRPMVPASSITIVDRAA